MILTKFNRLFVATFILLSTLSGCLLPKKAEPVPLLEPVYLWSDGVAVEIQPPAGFLPAMDFVGFAHDSLQIAINFNVVEKYFDDYAKDYSAENFEYTGIKLFSREELMVDGKNALLFHSEYADPTYALHHLRMGLQLGIRTLQLEAVYAPSSGKGTKDYLKRSFLSVKHLKNATDNQYHRLGFEVDLSEVPLKLTGVCGLTCLFETSEDSLELDEAGFTISLYDYPSWREDTNVFVQEMMAWRAQSREIETDSLGSTVLNGMQSWTSTGTKMLPDESKVYHYFEGFFFLDESFYEFAGMSSRRHAFWLKEFEKIMASFKTH